MAIDVTELLHWFAVEDRFGCHASEPGFTGDITAIDICLIDYLGSSFNFQDSTQTKKLVWRTKSPKTMGYILVDLFYSFGLVILVAYDPWQAVNAQPHLR